jgi:hypothetical protein
MNQETRPLPAGWHPDPTGQPGQRYHNGQRWTDHFVPNPPPVQAPAVAVAVSAGGGTSHGLHAVLTLLSCGLWLPIWILVAIFSSGTSASSSVAIGPGGAIAKAGSKKFVPLMVVGTLILIGVVKEHPWLLAVAAVVGGIAAVGLWVLKSAQQREQDMRREQFERDMLASRADYEEKLYNEGDPRGTYGRYMP